MEFEAHGQIEVLWVENVLHVKFIQSFNTEGAMEACRKIELQMPNSKQPWSRIDIYTDKNILAPLDATEILSNHIQQTKLLGCKLFCIVGCNSLIQDYFSKLFILNEVPFFFTNSYEEAVTRATNLP